MIVISVQGSIEQFENEQRVGFCGRDLSVFSFCVLCSVLKISLLFVCIVVCLTLCELNVIRRSFVLFPQPVGGELLRNTVMSVSDDNYT